MFNRSGLWETECVTKDYDIRKQRSDNNLQVGVTSVRTGLSTVLRHRPLSWYVPQPSLWARLRGSETHTVTTAPNTCYHGGVNTVRSGFSVLLGEHWFFSSCNPRTTKGHVTTVTWHVFDKGHLMFDKEIQGLFFFPCVMWLVWTGVYT